MVIIIKYNGTTTKCEVDVNTHNQAIKAIEAIKNAITSEPRDTELIIKYGLNNTTNRI